MIAIFIAGIATGMAVKKLLTNEEINHLNLQIEDAKEYYALQSQADQELETARKELKQQQLLLEIAEREHEKAQLIEKRNALRLELENDATVKKLAEILNPSKFEN